MPAPPQRCVPRPSSETAISPPPSRRWRIPATVLMTSLVLPLAADAGGAPPMMPPPPRNPGRLKEASAIEGSALRRWRKFSKVSALVYLPYHY